MFVSKDILNVVLLLQLVVNGQQEWCTEGEFRKLPLGESNGIFIQYCSGGSWHYLCSGGVGWTPTLATVVCRQLGYSDQGAEVRITGICNALHGVLNTFRINQACTGMENLLTECGEVQVNQVCYCSEVAEIICKPTVNVTQSTTTTATISTISSMDIVSPPTTTITTMDSVSPTTTSQDDNTTSINNTALGAVVGVLVALVAVVLITAVCIVVIYMCKQRSAVHQQSHQLEGSPTKRNESYTFIQPGDPVYDDASSTLPNLINNKQQFEDPFTKRNECYSSIQLTSSVYDDASSTQPNYRPVRGEASKKRYDFHDAQEHTL